MLNASQIAARTRSLLASPAVVGFEAPFFDTIESIVTDLGHRVERRHGLLAVAGGPVTISAHVDRHGFVTASGGRVVYASSVAAHRSLGPRQATVVCRRFAHEHVAAYDPESGVILAVGTVEHGEHCGMDGVELSVPELSEIPPGIPVGFVANEPHKSATIAGQLDNALSVAIAIELLSDGFDGSVLFTAGEEAGVSWKALVKWFGEPTDQLVVLDTSPFDDGGAADRGAVVLRARDAGGTFSNETTTRMAEAAVSVGVEVVWKDMLLASLGRPIGRTELGRVVEATAGAVTGTTLQIPTTDYHTNHEATTLSAIAASARTLEAFLA